jgi:hypothetical protein
VVVAHVILDGFIAPPMLTPRRGRQAPKP